ncbi:MAG: hypothetical protein WB760_13430 [Xanthobacteraceae bacterium]
MSEVSVWDFLSSNLVTPVLEWVKPLQPFWDSLAQNPQRLAVICILGGAALAITGARLLLFSIVLVLATPDIVAAAGDHFNQTAADLTKILYVIGIVGGALGAMEATLKLLFGREAGAFAFVGLIGTALATLIPFIPRRR